MPATIYLANALGFYEAGRFFLDEKIIPRLKAIGVHVLEPFAEEKKLYGLPRIELSDSVEATHKKFQDFQTAIFENNVRLMQSSDACTPILDGPIDVDPGVANEIAHFYQLGNGPIWAVRNDKRDGHVFGYPVNPQILAGIHGSKGKLFYGKNAYEEWFDKIRQWCERFSS